MEYDEQLSYQELPGYKPPYSITTVLAFAEEGSDEIRYDLKDQEKQSFDPATWLGATPATGTRVSLQLINCQLEALPRLVLPFSEQSFHRMRKAIGLPHGTYLAVLREDRPFVRFKPGTVLPRADDVGLCMTVDGDLTIVTYSAAASRTTIIRFANAPPEGLRWSLIHSALKLRNPVNWAIAIPILALERAALCTLSSLGDEEEELKTIIGHLDFDRSQIGKSTVALDVEDIASISTRLTRLMSSMPWWKAGLRRELAGMDQIEALIGHFSETQDSSHQLGPELRIKYQTRLDDLRGGAHRMLERVESTQSRAQATVQTACPSPRITRVCF